MCWSAHEHFELGVCPCSAAHGALLAGRQNWPALILTAVSGGLVALALPVAILRSESRPWNEFDGEKK